MAIIVDVQFASECIDVPDRHKLTNWARACLEPERTIAELTIRIVDMEEITRLNKSWRGIDKATNVLAFPSGGSEIVPELLGDIVICAPVIRQEALEQGKTADAHWAHMVIHGVLHLLGYDHVNDDDCEEMETIEIETLKKLDFSDPYN